MTVSIEFKGCDKVLKKLGEIQGRQWLRGLLRASALDIKGWIAQYPPSSEANRPNARGRWYERGYGPKWLRKDGTVGGRRTSETLGRKWTTQVAADGSWAKVGNNASYNRYVQDEEKQAKVHKTRGWRTVQQAVREKGPELVEKAKRAIERIWRQ